MENARANLVLGSLAALGVATSCLPGDDRPEPGSVLVETSPSDETAHGFTTPDGWTITFDRVLAAIGRIRLQGADERDDGSCTAYFEPEYERLFDFVHVTTSKVGLAYGLGRCRVEYRIRAPADDSLLEAGATSSDVETMNLVATDAHADDQPATLIVTGAAERNGVTKRFDWTFRHRYNVERCPNERGDGFVNLVDLAGGDARRLLVVVHAEELFRAGATDDSPLGFEPYAVADLDGDGDITVTELDFIGPPAGGFLLDDGGGGGGGASGTGSAPPMTLGAFVYDWLLPRVTRMDGGGACETELRDD